MATLIAVYDSDGCVGRCDARCYNAKHDHCNCVCGGKNHQKGFAQAVENVRELAEKELDACIDAYLAQRPDLAGAAGEIHAKLGKAVEQLSLPEGVHVV